MRNILLAAVLSVSSTLLAQPATQPSPVPVRAVTIYSSGVAYFEHAGTVHGNADTELRFKTAQINDILKSLVLQDESGGKVSVVSYPSQDPLEKTLRSFEIDLTANPALDQILNQLRGANVTLVFPDSKVSGTVVGVEKKPHAATDKAVVELPSVNLFSNGALESFDLEHVRSIEIENPKLQQELTKALAALGSARDKDQRPVSIHFTGNGDRHVRIGYVVEAPVWKTSYRLILDDTAKLQGWAIVENQTDSDWNGVQLNLVSGRPISFIQDLYSPLYVPRPTVQSELYSSLMPQLYAEGMARRAIGGAMDKSAAGQLMFRQQQQAAQAPHQFGMAAAAAPANAPADVTASIASVASTADLGELFQYTIPDVTLERQKSAMLPIVTDSVEAEKLSIYNASVLANHPLNGARLKNTTGKYLLGGPVTVLQEGIYAGDAKIDSMPPGQSRLLSYGIDLKMIVRSKNLDQQQQVVSGKIVKGVLELQRKTIATQEYHAQNKADKDKTLLIEDPIRPGWQLIDSPKPFETTDTLNRFKISVPAGKTTDLTVKQQIVQGESLALISSEPDAFAFYRTEGAMPAKVREALSKAITMKQAVADTDRQIQEKKQRLADYTTEQARLRENLRVVSDNAQYHARILAKLNDQETAIEKIQGEIETLTTQLKSQRSDLENYLNNLNVE